MLTRAGKTAISMLSFLTMIAFTCEAFEAKFEDAVGITPKADFAVTLLETNAPGNIFNDGEQPQFSFQVQSKSKNAIEMQGSVKVISFAMTRTKNIWQPAAADIKTIAAVPLSVSLKPSGWQNFQIRLPLPETYGGCAAVVDLGDYGRQLLTTYAHCLKVEPQRVQFPTQSFQPIDPPVAERLGLRSIRYNTNFYLPDSSRRKEYEEQLDQLFTEMHKHNVTVLVQMAASNEGWPLGVYRPFLDENNQMKGGKGDRVWLPEYDDEFEDFVYWIAKNYGWPKGPVTAFNLWNEPWEGSSISGWGSDMLRYREIYSHIATAVVRARENDGVQVLVGGCDSSPNAWDKLFPDGTATMLPLFDFVSIHYQGLRAPVLHKMWHNRQFYTGRVKIWDTESWVANSDDVFSIVVATNRAAGYDRAMGVNENYVIEGGDFRRRSSTTIQTEQGRQKVAALPHAMPMAASVAAVQNFLGERPFREILFQNGLPWMFVFDGHNGKTDDGTVVLVGDIQPLFNATHTLFRTVRDLQAVEQLDNLMKQNADAVQLEKAVNERPPIQNAKLTLADAAGIFRLYDHYGNQIPAENGKYVIPLTVRGFFLKTDGSPGSFEKLLAALRSARIDGLQPVEIVAHDMLAPVTEKPQLRLTLTNVLNRPINGRLRVALEGCEISGPATASLKPHETAELTYTVEQGAVRSDNRYPLRVAFDAGADGRALHYERMRVNVIMRRTVTVDGELLDWAGALPQIVETDEAAALSFTEAVWKPYEKLEAGETGGMAVAYMGYDDNYFYFAAKIADDTPHPGTLRFWTRDDSEFFYPQVSYGTDRNGEKIEYRWPEGVRRFSYRKNPVLPGGSVGGFDNVQIAFNAIPMEDDPLWLTNLPGRPPKFVWYRDTDYEYALNKVAPEYGGGTEVWRMTVPDMPRKHFFPRQPRNPKEGPVRGAQLVTVYKDGQRITELAMPWSELPDVKRLLDQGKTVKFSYRVNNNKRGPLMELAKDRSVSRLNRMAFHASWTNHWANEIEFAFEGK